MLNKRGFTLIEVLISVGIFAIVVVIALGALLAMSEADRKAQSLKSVINNLNFALESMSRTIRTGYDYKCGSPTGGDCANGDKYIAFTDAYGQKVAYCYYNTVTPQGVVTSGVLKRERIPSGTLSSSCGPSTPGNPNNFLAITSSEVVIEKLTFYVVGSSRTDQIQPRVTILMSGYVLFKQGGGSGSVKTEFSIQTTVTQRIYDK